MTYPGASSGDKGGSDRRSDPVLSRVHWRTASVAVFVIAVTILPAFMTGALAIRIGDDVGIDLAGIGGLYGVLFGTAALASAPTGRLVQRFGWEIGIRAAATGTGFALIAMATFSDDWWASWWPIAAVFVLAGVTAAASQVASNLALAQSVPSDRYGLLFGLKHSAVPAAAMLGGLAVPTIALTIGWRQAFAAAAILAFATALAVPRRRDRPGVAARSPASSQRPATPVSTLIALAVAAALGHAGIDALGAFVVPYAVSEGVAEGLAGVLLATGSLAGLITRLAAGWKVDSRQHAGLPWMATLLLVGSLGFLVLSVGGRPLLVAGVLLAFAGGWGWAGLLTFVVVRANAEAAAVATGIANTGKYVGAGLGPVLFGYLAERVSFAAAWGLACVLLLTGAVLVLVVRMTEAGREMAAPPPKRTA
jgi:MFS family permease